MFAPRGWLKRPVARRIYRTIASSDLFDAHWYRSTQVSGPSALMDPIWHYLDHGASLGLDPSPRFDTSHYVHAHHDVRSSGLNPLFHYLEYGKAERRSPLRSVLRTRDVLLPETAELETFTSPQTPSPRVTLVTDSRSEIEHSLTLAEIVDSGQKFAQKRARTLRVIAWPGSGDLSNTALPGVSVIEARRSYPAPTFDIHADELFVSTSSTSALSIRHIAPQSHLWKLTSGKTTSHQPWKSPPSLTDLPPQESSLAREHRTPSAGRRPLVSEGRGKTVMVFADALANPVNYVVALEELDHLFLDNTFLADQWNVTVVGQGVEPLMLADEVPVTSADHISRTKIAGIDVAIMTTPDPQVEAWCRELGVPVVAEISGSAISSALLKGRP